jgi:metallophosphoesterase (TIGR00282 family)
MKIAFFGDIVGRSGRDALCGFLPKFITANAIDFVVVSGDNAAGGFDINADVCKELFKAGADVITCGDHVWDQKEIVSTLSSDKRVLRPHNFPATAPGSGIGQYESRSGKKVAVIHTLGQVFIADNVDCPFACTQKALEGYKLGGNVDAIIVDFHAEATSEKMAMGHFCDGRVSLVVGSHTHIPTNDAHIMSGGTAYQTDAGMCGDYNSIIGMDKDSPMQRFISKIRKNKMTPATGAATLCGTLVETDDKTGLAKSVEVIKVGGVLEFSQKRD